MKKLIIIPLLFITLSLCATKYYVTPRGNDSNNGSDTTSAHAWLTWQKAFNSTPASDTCYFRGGTYSSTVTVTWSGNDGTRSYPTCFFNYLTEVPVIDFSSKPDPGAHNYGIRFNNSNNVYFKGLTVKNVRQYDNDSYAFGWKIDDGNNVRFENCTVHHIGGTAFDPSNYDNDTTYYINCDAHNNCDSLTAYDPGGGGFGFHYNTISANAQNSYIYYKGCRAWNNSDLGFGGVNDGTVIIDSCWAIHNGFYGGALNGYNGTGFKMGWTVDPKNALIIIIKNCIAAFNTMVGLTDNDTGYPQRQMHIDNNFIYSNGYDVPGYPVTAKYGFMLFNNSDSIGRWNCWYRNNLSYNNYGKANAGDYFGSSNYYREENNYWLNNATVTDADFVSLDSTGMCGARQADGSLPITTFGHLAATSNLINAGTVNTGLPYVGDAPDIGWNEYSPLTGINPTVSTIDGYQIKPFQATAGGIVTSDGGGTVSTRGVCYSTSANPTTADSKVASGSGTGSFTVTITGLSPSTLYHIRAYATNETGTGYGADETFTTRESSIVKYRGKIVKR